jgi:DHA2 family multidrug resistance protein
MFMPLTMATIGPLPKDKVASASGFFSLTRQLGGSIGIAAITTILDQRQTFHRSILVENIHLSNPNLLERWQLFSGMLSTNSSDNELAHSGGMAIIESLIQVQAALLSYADCFWLVGMIFLLCLPLVLLLGDGKNLDSAMSGGH